MHGVLNDEALYDYTGRKPPSLGQLKDKYERLETQLSPDACEAWLNWILRLRDTGTAIGTVQAGVSDDTASLAWVVGVPWQGKGFASEAALGLVNWLVSKGLCTFAANIHPQNVASQLVARRVGLTPTSETVEGETVWRRAVASSSPGTAQSAQ